jgi:hypothetical protein
MSGTKREPGCVRCQQRHVKCDRDRPACSNCQKSKPPTVCEYRAPSRSFRFQQSRYSSAAADEAARRATASRSSDAPSQPGLVLSEYGDMGSINSPRDHADFHPQPAAFSPPGSAGTESHHTFSATDGSFERDGGSVGSRFVSTPADFQAGEASYSSPSALVVHIPQSQQQMATPQILTDERDSRVFTFYMESVAHWMDIGSPGRYFQTYVPSLAFRDPLVLHACMSCAAHIMYLQGHIDKGTEEDYVSRVLSLLIPLLSSDEATSRNESLLATTVILRMAEQFSDISADCQHHLNGAASLFKEGADWSAVEVNLSTTCFWTSMRERLRIWFLHEQTTEFDVGHVSLSKDDMSSAVASEEAWTNRMTYLLARVCESCWKQDRGVDLEEVVHLKRLIQTWRSHLPDTFRPWCFVDRNNHPFPMIRCLSSWHGRCSINLPISSRLRYPNILQWWHGSSTTLPT